MRWNARGGPSPNSGALPPTIIIRQLKIVGRAVGTQKDAREVMDPAARGIIKTHYRLENMDKLTEIFEMSEGKMVGRVVLDLE
jgi:alcohol dehydrogenase, propanol-preferring